MSELTFKSEQERDMAIVALDTYKGDDIEEKLASIEAAKIVEEESHAADDVEKTDSQSEEVLHTVEKVEQPTTESGTTKAEDEIFTVKKTDLPLGYKNLDTALKSLIEKEDLIQKQSTKIRELLENHPVQKEVLQRAETAQKNLEKTEVLNHGAASAKTTNEINAIKSEIKRVSELQAELEREAEKDEDVVFTAEYKKKERELQKLQTKNLIAVAEVMERAQNEIVETKTATSKYLEAKAEEERALKASQAMGKIYEQVDSIDIPELKMSKGVRDVEADYLKWRRNLAVAYFGRQPKDINEELDALEQAQLRNPKLMQNCSVIGCSIEPTTDIKKYLEICSATAYVKEKNIGEYVNGEFKLLPVGDAVKYYRGMTGYHESKMEDRYQKGAESAARAAMRRDVGAVEIGADDQHSTIAKDQSWADKVLSTVDPIVAVNKALQGDMAAFNERNEALKLYGLPPDELPPQ